MTTYRLVLEGELSDRFAATFPDMQLERGLGHTTLTGDIADQAQLQGLIAHVADFGLTIRSFGQVPAAPELDDGTDPSDENARGISGGNA